jgi:uncharacterized DUF497 family protein
MAPIFEWDPEKARRNYAKHGVTFEEASTVFLDSLASVVEDRRTTADEYRFFIIGMTASHRLIAVLFTDRNRRIRIISARPLTRAERILYEETPK